MEPRPAVRVPERRDEGRAPAAERDARDAHARVAHPVRLQELGRGAEEEPLALHLVELVRQRAVLADGRTVVVTASNVSR